MNLALHLPPITRHLLLAAALLALSACGFHLRGLADLSFNSLYIQPGDAPTILTDIKRSLASSDIKLTGTAEEAELHLELMSESTEKRILSLSGGGKVREYELFYRVHFRTRSASSEIWAEPQQVEGRRSMTYDDTKLLSKEAEEVRLYNDMRADAAREIMRQLSALKPAAADAVR